MTFLPCTDRSAADWLTDSAWPWDRLVTFGPEGFPAYARLRVIPDPERDDQHEGDVEPVIDLPEVAQVGVAVAVLAGHTRAPHHCYAAWWDGWGDPVAGFTRAELAGTRFDVPHRSYFLLEGSLADVAAWAAGADGTAPADRPAFVWPADRAW